MNRHLTTTDHAQAYRFIRTEVVKDLVHWLHEVTQQPPHRKDWARGKATLCRRLIRELTIEIRSCEQ